MEQHVEALQRGNEIRQARAAEKQRLRDGPRRHIARAIIDPTPAFATYRIGDLFAGSGRYKGMISRFGPDKVATAMDRLNERYPLARFWHEGLRLDELLELERRRLARVVLEVAPAERQAA